MRHPSPDGVRLRVDGVMNARSRAAELRRVGDAGVCAEVLEGPWGGIEVSGWNVDGGEKDAPGPDGDEVEALEASDAGASGQRSGKRTEALGHGKSNVGGWGLGDEERAWRKGEKIAGKAVGSLRDGR